MSKFIEFETDNGKRLVHVDKIDFVAPLSDEKCLVHISSTTQGKIVVRDTYQNVYDRLMEKK